MTSKIEVALISLILKQIVLAVDYQSSILTQRITHYENPYVDLDLKYYGDEGYPYMIYKDDITPYNDFHVILYAKVYDGFPNLFVHAPLSLCKLLHEEAYEKNHNISQFHIPQIFNLAGRTCPIEQERIRLSPYVLPSTFTSETDFGCGYMNVEARLMKCSEEFEGEQNSVCETLIKSVTLALLTNDNCKDRNFTSEDMSNDGWNIQNVDR